MAKPEILSRMADYEDDQIEFSILSLGKDPIIDLIADLAQNVKSLQTLKEWLDASTSPSEEANGIDSKASPLDGTIYGPDGSFDLKQDDIDKAEIPSDKMAGYTTCSVDQLLSYQDELSTAQETLRREVKQEKQLHDDDETKAMARKHDYASAVHRWISMLARKGKIEELINAI